MENSMKFGYGDIANIDSALESGTLDQKDLVLTKDTSELVYIKSDQSKQFIRPRILRFDSVEDATTELNKNTDTYAGQPIVIKSDTDEKYYPYTVQGVASAFTVDPVMSTITNNGMVWTEF